LEEHDDEYTFTENQLVLLAESEDKTMNYGTTKINIFANKYEIKISTPQN
jgi:hypothetical protein